MSHNIGYSGRQDPINCPSNQPLQSPASDDIGLIITAAMMEAGMTDDQTVAELPDAIRKLKQQLLRALAAVKFMLERDGLSGVTLKEIDLSPLDKHDEEVRKPLVDALERITKLYGQVKAKRIAADALKGIT